MFNNLYRIGKANEYKLFLTINLFIILVFIIFLTCADLCLCFWFNNKYPLHNVHYESGFGRGYREELYI